MTFEFIQCVIVYQSDDDAKESLVHSYTKSFNAFAAKLSEDEAKKLMGTESS